MFSSHHSLSFPLHHAIIEDDTALFSAALKQYPEKIETPDTKGHTPLQLAAMTGNIHAILSLLYNGANIDFPKEETPFFLALHFQQRLAAHLLHFAGAKKSLVLKNSANKLDEFSPDHRLFGAMLLWASIQNNEKKIIVLLKKILSNASCLPTCYAWGEEKKSDTVQYQHINKQLSGILNLLEQKRYFQAAKIIYEKYPDSIGTTPFSASWGYWATVNGDLTGYKLIENNVEHVFLTLHQLQVSGKDKLFQKQFISLTAKNKKEYITQVFPEDELSGFSKIIYSAAKYAKNSLLQNYKGEFDMAYFVETADYSLKHHNYVALFSIFNQEIDYLTALLDTSQKDLLLMYTFFINTFPNITPENYLIYLTLLNEEQGIPGAVNRFLFKGLSGIVDSRPKDEIQFQKKFFKLSGIDEKQWIQSYFKICYQRDDIHSLEDICKHIEPCRWHSIMEHAQRFGFKLTLNEEKKHSQVSTTDQVLNIPGIVPMVRSYLTMSENSRLNEVSSLFLKTEIHSLLDEIAAFLKLLEETIARKMSYGKKANISVTLMIIILFLSLMIVCSVFSSSTKHKMSDVFDILYALNSTTGTSCDSWLPRGRRSAYCNSGALAPCDMYCDELFHLNNENEGWMIGAVISGLLILFSSPFFSVFSTKKNEYLSMKLNDFPIIQDRSVILFSRFRGDPQFTLGPESRISEVKDSLQKYVSRLTLFKPNGRTIVEIKEEPKSPHLIEINEERNLLSNPSKFN